MMSISKTINFYFKMTLIFLFIVNIKAQSLNTESSNKYNKNFEDARLIFHRVYRTINSVQVEQVVGRKPHHFA